MGRVIHIGGSGALSAHIIRSRPSQAGWTDFDHLHFATMAARVDLTPKLERRVSEIMQMIRRGRHVEVVDRSHTIPCRRAGLSMRERCDGRLA